MIDGSQINRTSIICSDTQNHLGDRARRSVTPIHTATSKYPNNPIEKDHRRRMSPNGSVLGFKSTATDEIILSKIEVIHVIRKRPLMFACNPSPWIAE